MHAPANIHTHMNIYTYNTQVHPSTLMEEKYPHHENVPHIHSAMGNLKAQMIKIKGCEEANFRLCKDMR